MYPYSLYPRPYPFHYGPTLAEVQLASENRRLNTEVDILLSENRRLRTQILTKDLSGKYHTNDNNLAYAGNARIKEQRTQKKGTYSTNPNTAEKKVDSGKKYSSPYWDAQYTKRNLSEQRGANSRKSNQRDNRKSAPKYNYGVRNESYAMKQSQDKGTIIEELRSQGIKSSPPGIIRILTNKNDVESPRPFTIRQQDQFITNNNGTNIGLEQSRRSNRVYLQNYRYEQSKHPGAKLNRLSKIQEKEQPKTAPKPQKHFLTLISKTYESTKQQEKKEENSKNVQKPKQKVEDPEKKAQQ